jgi:choline dehydrogenase-like flavoprotein
VHYLDRLTGRDEFVPARAVVLAASACETARIMLNSKSTRFPDGLANGSGLVGRYLMDTVGSRMLGQIPALENIPPHNADGSSGMHMYMPWWRYGAQARGELDFARGYHIEFGGGRRMPGPGSFDGLEGLTSGSFGVAFKDDCRRYYGSFVGFSGRGEMIPNKDCYCEIDPDRKDRFGIPILRFHWRWSEHELNQARHMQRTFRDIIGAMGGRMASPFIERGEDAIAKPGEIIHEVGGAIMGDDRATSVVNQFGQAWEVSNLFLTDGAPFVSNADKNPTLSIMALAWRSSDHLIGQIRGRDL